MPILTLMTELTIKRPSVPQIGAFLLLLVVVGCSDDSPTSTEPHWFETPSMWTFPGLWDEAEFRVNDFLTDCDPFGSFRIEEQTADRVRIALHRLGDSGDEFSSLLIGSDYVFNTQLKGKW